MKVQRVANTLYWTRCAGCHQKKWGKAMGKDVCDTTLLNQNRNETNIQQKKGKDTIRTLIKRKRKEECVCLCACVSVYTGNESDIKI